MQSSKTKTPIRESHRCFLILSALNLKGLPGKDLEDLAVLFKPHGGGGGVMDGFTVQREAQAVVSVDIIVNLDIVCVPDVVLAADLFAEFLDHVPVIIALEFIGVTPEVTSCGSAI